MKKTLLAAAFCLFNPVYLFAAPSDAASAASIDHLMKLTKVESIIETIFTQTDQMMMGMAQQMGIQGNERPLFDQYVKDIQILMRTEISWEKMRAPLVAVYADTFTQKEVDDMVAFYKTESGQSLIEKMPGVMNQSMEVSQKLLMSLMPQIQNMSMQFEQKIKQARALQE